MEPVLTEYDDLLANVRYDNRFHSIRSLVQPFDPDVVELAGILHGAPDFIEASHAFVHSFTYYQEEVGDYWRTPRESMDQKGIDCDDSAILLCSLLRNYIPANQVFCAVGMWVKGGNRGGHMWVDVREPGKPRQILESTAASDRMPYGLYEVSALFNDEYTFATPRGLKEFGLIPTEDVVKMYEKAGAIPAGT
jgi:hypothetical protein